MNKNSAVICGNRIGPDIAGQDILNPIGTILSAAVMTTYGFDRCEESDAAKKTVYDVFGSGFCRAAIMPSGETNCTKVGCHETGQPIADRLRGHIS